MKIVTVIGIMTAGLWLSGCLTMQETVPQAVKMEIGNTLGMDLPDELPQFKADFSNTQVIAENLDEYLSGNCHQAKNSVKVYGNRIIWHMADPQRHEVDIDISRIRQALHDLLAAAGIPLDEVILGNVNLSPTWATNIKQKSRMCVGVRVSYQHEYLGVDVSPDARLILLTWNGNMFSQGEIVWAKLSRDDMLISKMNLVSKAEIKASGIIRKRKYDPEKCSYHCILALNNGKTRLVPALVLTSNTFRNVFVENL